MRLFVADLSLGNISSSSALSVMSKSSGHERLISAAFFKTLATVFLEMFERIWIPLEERYFWKAGVEKTCDISLDTTGLFEG